MRTARSFALLMLATSAGCVTDKSEPAAPKPLIFALTPRAVPACASAPATATGTVTIIVASDGSSITATVVYSGLSGEPTAAHFHFGKPGAAGPVVLPFTGSLTSPFSKTFTSADYVAAAGAPPDFASFVNAFKAGGAVYVNVHTAACRPGEIRADIPSA
jgi:CHRD domain